MPHPNARPSLEIAIEKRVFTTGTIAKLLKVAPRTVSKWCDMFENGDEANGLKHYRIPNSKDRRIPFEDLKAFCDKHGIRLPFKAQRNVLAFCAFHHIEALHDVTHISNIYDIGKSVAVDDFSHAIIDNSFGFEMMMMVAGDLVMKRKDTKIIFIVDETTEPSSIQREFGGDERASVFQTPLDYAQLNQMLEVG